MEIDIYKIEREIEYLESYIIKIQSFEDYDTKTRIIELEKELKELKEELNKDNYLKIH